MYLKEKYPILTNKHVKKLLMKRYKKLIQEYHLIFLFRQLLGKEGNLHLQHV